MRLPSKGFFRRLIPAVIGVSVLLFTEHVFSLDAGVADAVAGMCRSIGYGPKPPRPVILVSIPGDVPRPRGPLYPREIVARSLQTILDLPIKPRQIFIDVFLESSDPPGDLALVAQLSRPEAKDRVVLARDLDFSAEPLFPKPLAEAYEEYPTGLAFFPIEEGMIREVEPFTEFGEHGQAHAAMNLLPAGTEPRYEPELIDTRMRPEDVFRIYPASKSGEVQGLDGMISPDDVVIIGPLDPIFRDVHPFAIDLGESPGNTPGPIITSYAYQTLLLGAPLQRLGMVWGWVLALVLLVLCAVRTRAFTPIFRQPKIAERAPMVFRFHTALLIVLYAMVFAVSIVFGLILPLSLGISAIFVGSELNDILFPHSAHVVEPAKP